MAQAGEIRFDAVIDTSGYEKGVKDIQNATDEIKESAEQADKATEDVGKNGGKNAPSIKDAFSKTFDGIGELADGLGLNLPSKLVKVASIGGLREPQRGRVRMAAQGTGPEPAVHHEHAGSRPQKVPPLPPVPLRCRGGAEHRIPRVGRCAQGTPQD